VVAALVSTLVIIVDLNDKNLEKNKEKICSNTIVVKI